jgi:hypothetical protein
MYSQYLQTLTFPHDTRLRATLTEQSPALVLPVLAVVNPCLHGRHRMLPGAVEKVPSGQTSHPVPPSPPANCPAGHSRHCVAPSM